MANNIAIKIQADVSSAVNGINQVNQKLDSLQRESEASRKSLAAVAAGFSVVSNAAGILASGIGKVVDACSALVSAYSAQELSERRLQATLRATQNVIGMSVGELLELADAFSKASTYTDQEILAVEQMLVATRKISRETLPEATKAVLDMASATGEDLTGAAQRLAQALSDPAGEIESLKEAGIQLTEQQKKNIQTVQDQNGIYDAQKLILDEVAGTYGDMAEAIADTDTGKLEKIGNVWSDIKEGLGYGLLDAINPALDTLYERLLDISEWIDNVNSYKKRSNEAESHRAAGSTDLSGISSDVLQQMVKDSAYGKWLASMAGAVDEYGNPLDDGQIKGLAERGIAHGGFTREDMVSYQAAVAELARREQATRLGNLWGTQDIQRTLTSWSPTTPWQSLLEDPYQDARLNLAKSYNIKNAFGFLDAADPRASFSPQGLDGWMTGYGGSLYKDTSQYGIDAGLISSRLGIGASYNIPEPAASEPSSRNPLGSFLAQYSGLSTTSRVNELDDAIRASQSWMAEVDPDSDTYKQLSEINAALREQRDALLDSGEAGETAMEKLQRAFEGVNQFMQPILSIGDSFATIMQNMADAAEDKLSKIQEKWDEYFDELDEKQGRQADSLNAMLASGYISYEDYIDSMNALDDARAEAEEEAAEEEEEQRKKANELGKAAFIANQVNSIAEASMNIAQGVTEAIAQGGIAGIALGSIVAAAGAAQIAAIASQQYTPLAAGGIVTSPTHALIGEGGSPEAILPLNEQNLDKYGFGGATGGVINISISIGAVYSKEALADEIFKGIERAQRTGALPAWRYSA